MEGGTSSTTTAIAPASNPPAVATVGASDTTASGSTGTSFFSDKKNITVIVYVACFALMLAIIFLGQSRKSSVAEWDAAAAERKQEEKMIAVLNKWAAENGLFDRKRSRSKSKKE